MPLSGYQHRCGYGQRLPMMVISPYAKVNYIDNTATDQSSITRFIEDYCSAGSVSAVARSTLWLAPAAC